VTPWLQTALIAVSLLIAALAAAYVVLDRVVDRWLLAPVALLALLTLIQLVTGIIALANTDREVSGPTFVGYLIGLVLVPPAATIWALGERSRAGTAVLIVAGLLVPVLMLRLDQIWTASSA
jgi:hypothetical protein